MRGLAADIATETTARRYDVLSACLAHGFKRFGIGRDFVHVDGDPDKSQGAVWVY